MNCWTQHEKKWGRYYQPIPKPQLGSGWSDEKPREPDPDFKRDEKTGLFLPEQAAKERRKVKTGFQPKDDDAS